MIICCANICDDLKCGIRSYLPSTLQSKLGNKTLYICDWLDTNLERIPVHNVYIFNVLYTNLRNELYSIR